MALLSAADLADLRAVQTDACDTTATVYRNGTTSNGAGGTTEAWAAVGSAITGRRTRLGDSATEQALAGRATGRVAVLWTLPVGQAVQTGDQIRSSGHTDEVLAVLPAGVELARQCVCVELT